MSNQLKSLINQEIQRQQMTLDLIPSENIADPELLKILGSPLTNKYSEGYPGKRYYPGNEIYDEIENLAQANALKAFDLKAKDWAVNVQPYSGSPANQAVYFALAKPGDVIMGLSLTHGGHLTHGHLVNFSGITYQSLPYGLNTKTGLIDYQNLEQLAKEHSPKIIISGSSAYPRKIDFKKIGVIAKKIGAYHLADISHIAGLVTADLHQSPFAYADVVTTTTHKTLRGPRGAVIFSNKGQAIKGGGDKINIAEKIDKAVFPGLQGGPHNNVIAAMAWAFEQTTQPEFKIYQKQIIKNAQALADELSELGFNLVTGGTDTHLMLIDLKNKKISGRETEKILADNGILTNRNAIVGDQSPFNPSGLRLGTPALTSRGMDEKEMKAIAGLIYLCLLKEQDIKTAVMDLCMRFPLPY